MEEISVATDGSEGGNRALRFAADLAASLNKPLSILTVSNPVLSAEWREFGRMEHLAIGDLLEVQAQSILKDAQKEAEALGARVAHCHALVGDAAEQILEFLADEKPSIAIIGRRGRGRLTGLLLGSVSQKLASLSPVPVTVVP